MQIQVNPSLFTTSQLPNKMTGPPPAGAIPPGLEKPMQTLSSEEQVSSKKMLESLTEDQQTQLKAALDELKPLSEDLSMEEMGSAFFDVLKSITQTESDNLVDVYA